MWPGVCAWLGGMHGWGKGVHDMHACMLPRQILRLQHTVNEQVVRILLECILVKQNLHKRKIASYISEWSLSSSWHQISGESKFNGTFHNLSRMGLFLT